MSLKYYKQIFLIEIILHWEGDSKLSSAFASQNFIHGIVSNWNVNTQIRDLDSYANEYFSLVAYSSTKTKTNTNTKTKAFVCSCMFWNKPVTKEPIILCNVTLRAWLVRHRHYPEQTKTFVPSFVFVFVLAHEQAIATTNKKCWKICRNGPWQFKKVHDKYFSPRLSYTAKAT